MSNAKLEISPAAQGTNVTLGGLEPRYRRAPDIVALRQFFERGPFRAPLPGLFLLLRCEDRGSAHMLSTGLGAAPAFGSTGADQVALNIGQAAEYRQHQAAVLLVLSAHGSAKDRNCALASTMRRASRAA